MNNFPNWDAIPQSKKTYNQPEEDEYDYNDDQENPAQYQADPLTKMSAMIEDHIGQQSTKTGGRKFGSYQGEQGAQAAPGGFEPSADVVVKSLPYKVREDQIWEHFGHYGKLISVKCLHGDDGNFRGICFLKYEDPACAAAAIADSGEEVFGRQVWIERARPRQEREGGFQPQGGRGGYGASRGGSYGGQRGGNFRGGRGGNGGFGAPRPYNDGGQQQQNPGQDNTIFVGNLNFKTTDASLWAAFEGIGNLKEARVARDHDGNSRGFAYIQFADSGSAQKALGMSGAEVDGRQIRCDTSTRNSGGSRGSYSRGGRGSYGGRGAHYGQHY